MTTATQRIGLCLEPLDVLFFRDGRPFTGSERNISGLPLPQTLAGAFRTALLRLVGADIDCLRQTIRTDFPFPVAVKQACSPADHWIGELTVRGPWLGRHKKNVEPLEVLVPCPADVHKEKGKHKGQADQAHTDGDKVLHRLRPLSPKELPAWHPPADQSDLQPLWLKSLQPTEPASGFLTPEGLRRYLAGEQLQHKHLVACNELYALDYRTGIGIAPDRLVAEESLIYSNGFLALKEGVMLYAELEAPADAPLAAAIDSLHVLPLGGEGRHVRLRPLDQPFQWPSHPPQQGQKPLVVLTTPCPFAAGWRPANFNGQIVAAAVPGAIPFSGWDLARGGPKPTRHAVPAGSVYFLDASPNRWPASLAETEDDRQSGWGTYLIGAW